MGSQLKILKKVLKWFEIFIAFWWPSLLSSVVNESHFIDKNLFVSLASDGILIDCVSALFRS